MVGAAGFELATLCSQSRCATRLRYAPTSDILTLKRRILGAEAKKVTYFEKLACAWWAISPCLESSVTTKKNGLQVQAVFHALKRFSAAARYRHVDFARQGQLLGQLQLGQRIAVHLVWAVRQAQGALVGVGIGQREVL